jgi:uncharacterized protein (DUF58 family)
MRGWQAALLVVAAGALGLATGSRSLDIAALALLVVLVIGVAYRLLMAGDVSGNRMVGDTVIGWGNSFTQRIELVNRSRLRIPAVRINDESTLPDHPHGYVTNLPALRSITWEVEVPCLVRGRYRLGPVEAHMSDPLGLFPVQREVSRATSVLVLPRWVPLRRSALKLDGFVPGEARGRRSGESPPSVAGIRDYAPGDHIAAIHWPASARSGQLMTKQFDPEVHTSLWLALDMDGVLPSALEELLVTVTTSLAMYALMKANLRVGMIASGALPATLASERGKPHQYRMQEILAEVHSGAAARLEAEFARLDRRLGPGQVVVLVTWRGPDVWGDWLGRLVRRGIATRVVQVQTDGQSAFSHWSVPALQLPLALGELAHENHLIRSLEDGGVTMRATELASV